jgi:methylenetetrahydrofolate dehydrogenase (NADP+) / methenyltetrahydrofolate cyclohydrolase
MTAERLLGKSVETIRTAALAELAALGRRAKVVAVHNPESPAARYYLRAQTKVCAEAGVDYVVRTLEPGADQARILGILAELAADPSVDGITVHTPLPKGVDEQAVWRAVAPGKDVEGIHPENLGRLQIGEHRPSPCAASAAVALARSVRPSMKGLEAVVVGRSALVGKAIAALLLQAKGEAPTVTICHTATADLAAHVRRADVLFAAAGKAGLIRGSMIKPGALVIDVGINEGPDGKVVGDVVFEEAAALASAISPVPGGVGPACHYILLRNIAACARATKQPL